MSGTPGPAIELRELRKTYRKKGEVVTAVDGLDLVVARGEVFGLLGPNGAGKTTTVEICEGLTEPDSGLARVLGREWRRGVDDEIRARIGVCLQETKFHEKATVRETLALFAAFFDRGRRVDEVLDLVSLREKASARQASLSGGQRQRLAVATALLGAPELLFLDEPTTGLDPQSRRQLWEVVRSVRAGAGTVLLTTHYMDEAQQLCDRVAIVDKGRVIALDTPRALIRSLGGEHCVEIDVDDFAGRVGRDDLRRLPGVVGVELSSTRAVLVLPHVESSLPGAVEALLRARGLVDHRFAVRPASLEDVFLHHTGRQLAEQEKP